MAADGQFIVVIGASAGGMRAVARLLPHLPADLPAAIVVVMHLPRSADNQVFLARLERTTQLPCHLAGDEMPLRPGHVYFAPANYHTLFDGKNIILGKGPAEGRWRPSIDVTLRSAAVANDSHCIGIVLTGMLDDGTAGMEAVKRCGGYTVIQDPNEADYPDMPLSVQRHLAVDACLSLAAIPAAIMAYIETGPDPAKVPDDLRFEAKLARQAATDPTNLPALGTHSYYSCPDCGGNLWELKNGQLTRYRCHIGHSYTQEELLDEQKRSADQTLWVALRTMEEKHLLLKNIAAREEATGQQVLARDHYARAGELANYIGRLKEFIFSLNTADSET
jgi:two-component system chemotaxis response regulator CheB